MKMISGGFLMSDKRISKKGTIEVTATLDRLANLFEHSHETLNIPVRVAKDFAYRCDLLSSTLEKQAGVTKEALTEYDPVKEPGFNPEEVGKETAGPLEGDRDEAYMDGEFDQQENRELREKVESGEISNKGIVPNERNPKPGKQAMDAQLAKVADALDPASDYVRKLTGAEAAVTELRALVEKVAGDVKGKGEGILEGDSASALTEFSGKFVDALKAQSKDIFALRDVVLGWNKAGVAIGGTVQVAINDVIDAVSKECSPVACDALKNLASMKDVGFMDFQAGILRFFTKVYKPYSVLVGMASKTIKKSVDDVDTLWKAYQKPAAKKEASVQEHGFNLFA